MKQKNTKFSVSALARDDLKEVSPGACWRPLREGLSTQGTKQIRTASDTATAQVLSQHVEPKNILHSENMQILIFLVRHDEYVGSIAQNASFLNLQYLLNSKPLKSYLCVFRHFSKGKLIPLVPCRYVSGQPSSHSSHSAACQTLTPRAPHPTTTNPDSLSVYPTAAVALQCSGDSVQI